eukprot:CAMPEP_0196723418 /NCGR_PEP_ID=MMETSP1091-20130531/5547_1 /TAXON_ID=302021 /ORGANISM="Rhodomonas sp., Strain CCMP768" /LENGTH=30 /DNA_ID= /DNA_START= /DNA_END= /DNA_ORIENTATION=
MIMDKAAQCDGGALQERAAHALLAGVDGDL